MQHTIASDYAQRALDIAQRQRKLAEAADIHSPAAQALRAEVVRWQIEVEGEQTLIALLATLSDQYYGFSGVPSEVWGQAAGGLIDYVVIGPTGVYAIDARDWAIVTLHEFEAEPNNIAEQARRLSEQLNARITNAEVAPLIALTSPLAELPIAPFAIGCVKVEALVSYLEAASTRFDDLTVAALADMLERTIETEREARHDLPTRVQSPLARLVPVITTETNNANPINSSVSLFTDPPSISRTVAHRSRSRPTIPGGRLAIGGLIALIVLLIAGSLSLLHSASTGSTLAPSTRIAANVTHSPVSVPTTLSPLSPRTAFPTTLSSPPQLPIVASVTIPTTAPTGLITSMPDAPSASPSVSLASATAVRSPVPGQPDTIGVYRSGTFFLRASNKSGNADLSIVFNVAANAYPIAGNWAGNGYDSVGVFDQQAARFSLCKAATSEACADAANVIQFVFGNPGDQPIVGQWVASATTDQVGIFRAADGLFALKADLSSGSAATMLTFGIPGDVGMLGDWAGNGYDSPGLFRRSTVTFFLSNQPIHSGQALIDSTVNFNTRYRSSTPQDIPIVGDWNGQGYDGIGVFHLGTFELRADSTSGYPDAGFLFGGAGDLPVVGRWPIGVSP